MLHTRDDVARLIDHTLSKPEATHSQIRELVEEADGLGICSMRVSPSLLPLPLDLGDVKLAVAREFPSEAYCSDVKAAEVARAVVQGADKIDIAVNPAQAVGNGFGEVEADIRAVCEATPRVVLKAIIESTTLSDEQVVAVCGAAKVAGANFVKTSTGLHPSGGASVHTIALTKATMGETMQVRAPDGIRDGKFAAELLDAGVTRLGLSANAKVLGAL